MTDEDREEAWKYGDRGGLPLYVLLRPRGVRESAPWWVWLVLPVAAAAVVAVAKAVGR